ncbi:hypothetical protein HPB50_000212 [Hyalomma asiaticum]|uniref:Uncharacterized protein n=1 Tax=Hyalomma asiaticum TaxID=266040 RepID=A0ACB7RQ01_HYAAI|nr:hypothetical protein HPB50_000212 [Hyalomma asiaticum]
MGVHPLLAAIILVLRFVYGTDASDGEETRAAWVGLDAKTQNLLILDGEPQEADFQTDSKYIPIAWGNFRNDINETGWSRLQIESNGHVQDDLQAYAAGVLEANLTRQVMEYQWTNLFGMYCENQTTYCHKLTRFLTENVKYTQEQGHRLRNDDPFWNMMHLLLKQMAGLSDVFENEELNASNELTGAPRVFYMNTIGDLQDLEIVLGRERDFYSLQRTLACSALVKVVGDFRDVYITDTTWLLYRAMLRIEKHYIFPWHRTAANTGPASAPVLNAVHHPRAAVVSEDRALARQHLRHAGMLLSTVPRWQHRNRYSLSWPGTPPGRVLERPRNLRSKSQPITPLRTAQVPQLRNRRSLFQPVPRTLAPEASGHRIPLTLPRSSLLRTLPQDIVPGHTWTMSSYPGMILSYDCFYLTSAGLAITETQLSNSNHDLFKLIKPTGSVLGEFRETVACRLSTTSEEWVRTVAQQNSGTSNNQVMVLDYKRFSPGTPIVKGTLWLYEQMPGITQAADVSDLLREKRYWASYNVA